MPGLVWIADHQVRIGCHVRFQLPEDEVDLIVA